ncbi:MAG TPA: glycosyltransferase family 4 protein [Polyangiaceae bacterium]|jgi:glycosyltransferase involved in cell wall biosynthesis
MPQRKKLLFVTDVFPYPPDSGQRVRVRNLLAACGRACDVTFVGPQPARAVEGSQVEEHCVATHFLPDTPSSLVGRVSSAARAAKVVPGLPRLSSLRKYAPFAAALKDVRPETFDLVWAERPHIAALCANLRDRTILDLDDIEHIKIGRLLKLQRGANAFAHNLYRYALYRHLELSWSKSVLALLVCSDEDRAYLERQGCRNTMTVPNGVSLREDDTLSNDDLPSSRRLPLGSRLRIAFLGNVAYPPNADAIGFFVDQVLPAVKARAPGATFDVIGPGAPASFVEQYRSQARFRGFVDDLHGTLAEYDVLVAPLRFGGGTKLKVLDGMAHRVPLVTTGIGAEGLSVKHGEHVLIAETAEAFVECILRINGDLPLADRLVSNAYALVRDRFSWGAIQDHVVDWLSELPAPS